MLSRLLDMDRRWTLRLRIADQPGLLRSVAALLAHSGDSWFWGFVLIPIAFWGPPAYARGSWIFLGGILITALLVFGIKLTVRRSRPEGEWGQIYRKTDPHSFPSGHAARAVLLAVLAIGLLPAWLALAMVVWAPLVVLARVAMGVHFVLDVLTGALLGGIVGLLILSFI